MIEDHEKESFLDILSGKFTNLPERKSNIVRIFFSSTFSGKLRCFRISRLFHIQN